MTEKEPIKDGVVETFYENGQLRNRKNYKNGKLDGLYEYYYKNGRLEQRGKYSNGKKDGLWKSFYFTSNNNPLVLHGPVKYRGNYKNGELILIQ